MKYKVRPVQREHGDLFCRKGRRMLAEVAQEVDEQGIEDLHTLPLPKPPKRVLLFKSQFTPPAESEPRNSIRAYNVATDDDFHIVRAGVGLRIYCQDGEGRWRNHQHVADAVPKKKP